MTTTLAPKPKPSVTPCDELLSRVLDHEFPPLLDRLQSKLGLDRRQAVELFGDTKRFLYLCATHPARMSPSPSIDSAWHEFLLYTEDYARFCHSLFGRFIHHRPTTPGMPIGDADVAESTYDIAVSVFGPSLSPNWRGGSNAAKCDKCESCSGTTNCQDKDCHDS